MFLFAFVLSFAILIHEVMGIITSHLPVSVCRQRRVIMCLVVS